MFVKQSTYAKLESDYYASRKLTVHWHIKYKDLLAEWNSTIDQINGVPGAWAFIKNKGVVKEPAPQFTQDDIKSLIQLVHPDKHDGKESAVRLTQVLLKLRE